MKAAMFLSVDESLPLDDMFAAIDAAGFEVIGLAGNLDNSPYITRDQRRLTGKLLSQYGMSVDAIHAPFRKSDQLYALDEEERQESIRYCRLALDAAAELDARVVSIHVILPYDIPHGEVRDEMIRLGRNSIRTLVDYAAGKHVKLALENGQRRDYDQEVEDALAEFTEAHVGFCYDVGHEHVQRDGFSLLEQLQDRLFCLHVHDNSGKDSHQLPFEGTVDWARFTGILRAMNYDGNMLLESRTTHSAFKDVPGFLSEAKRRADQLCRKVQVL